MPTWGKHATSKAQTRGSRILRWTQRALFTCAVSTLAYCAFVLMDAWTFQRGERLQLQRLLNAHQEAPGRAHQTASPALPGSTSLVAGSLIGSIEIARLGVSVIVVEGTSTTALRRAAGHVAGTALPGQPGNVGISGHRDTVFRPLRDIQRNDIITLITPADDYHYRVVSNRVVSPSDIAVLDPSGHEVLTLVTCYPFYFVGPAPDRFIVQAERCRDCFPSSRTVFPGLSSAGAE